MGMFDYIKVKKKLPLNAELKKLNLKWDQVEFQTKDLNSLLDNFFIDKKGLLYKEVVEGDWIPIPEDKRKNAWTVSNFVESDRYNSKVDYHGILNFYAYEKYDDKEDFWVDFAAYFIYGKLDKIELKEFNKCKSNKISNQELKKEFEASQKKLSFKIKKFLNLFGWKKFWLFVVSFLNKFSNLLTSYIYRYII